MHQEDYESTYEDHLDYESQKGGDRENEYQDGNHEEPQEGDYDHDYQDNTDTTTDMINRLIKETIPTSKNLSG